MPRILRVVASERHEEIEMKRIEELTQSVLTLAVFVTSYGVLAAVLYTIL
jgi:hypothetical protein